MGRRVITEGEFLRRFNEVEGYTYNGGYVRMSNKINITHDICGTTFDIVAAAFINRPRCKYCSNRRKNADSYNDEIIKKTDGEYSVIGEYVNDETEILYFHHTCENEFYMKPRNFTSGHRCKKCGRKYSRYSVEELNQMCKNRNTSHTVIDAYVNNKSIILKCDICGKEKVHSMQMFKANKIDLNNKCCLKELNFLKRKYKNLNKSVLRHLTKMKPKFERNKKYLKEAYDIHRTTLTIKTDVANNQDKFNVTCNTCENVFKTNFKNLRRGNGCPKCKLSKGERKIDNYLVFKNIDFKGQYMFEDKCINRLRFDFAIFKDNKILFLIEYDGKQHFSVDSQFEKDKKKAKEKFEETKRRDELKNRYCKVKGIKLLRISYRDYDNIESIIDTFLTNCEQIV